MVPSVICTEQTERVYVRTREVHRQKGPKPRKHMITYMVRWEEKSVKLAEEQTDPKGLKPHVIYLNILWRSVMLYTKFAIAGRELLQRTVIKSTYHSKF